MPLNIIVYGHADTSDEYGFSSAQKFTDFIAAGIFDGNKGDYSFSQSKNADIIVLAREGLAYGHFEIASTRTPNNADVAAHPSVKKVYQVAKSVLYSRPVRLAGLGVVGYQFGRTISDTEFQKILTAAGETNSYVR